MTAWQRARQPEQKQQRRRSILDGAATLFATQSYDTISMQAIATHAGIAKGNIYRYFATKEELFLQLYREGLQTWCAELEQELVPLAGTGDVEAVSHTITTILVRHPDNLALQSLLAGVLERNLPEETLVAFKESLPPLLERMVIPLRRALPDLPVRGAYQFYRWLYALLAGLWPMANPTPELDRVLARPHLANLRVVFEPSLTDALRHLLQGLIREGDQS